MKITFIGATHEVTGSCYYLEAAGKKFLVDCGMEQGPDYYENQDIPVKGSDLDFVLLTHAHMDHSGNLPAIYAKGFQGPIYATQATCHLCDIMLRDSAHIQMFEAEWRNRKGRRQGKPEFVPAYTMEDAMGVIQNFVPCPYEKTIKPAEGISVRFVDAGSWIENEVKDFIPDGFEMAFMPTPAIDGAKTDENGNIIQLCNTEAGDFAYVPKNAANVKAAKAFLAFMNRPEWIEKFTLYAGMPRPFNYKPSAISGISSFTKSSMEYYENSVKMWRVSDSPIYTYAGIRQWDPYGSTTVYGQLAGS